MADTLFFFAVGTEGRVWKTDGTAAGTRRIGGMLGHRPSQIHALDDDSVLVLALSDSKFVYSLWRIDQGADDAILVLDNLGDSHGRRDRPHDFTQLDGRLYFGMASGLWRTDGTPEGTGLLKASQRHSAHSLVNVDGTLFFSMDLDGLWKSDGTSLGTTPVVDGMIVLSTEDRRNPPIVNRMGSLFFRGELSRGNITGDELWTSDGTAEGTVLVRDLAPGKEGSRVSQMTVVSNGLFFIATGDDGLRGLWFTEGSTEATHEVRDLSGATLTDFGNVFSVNDTLFLTADDGLHGNELWMVRDVLDGDLNFDGRVDFADFLAMSHNFGKMVDAVWADGDLNDNGSVDFADFEILARRYGNTRQAVVARV